MKQKKPILIIIGSASDEAVVQKGIDLLKKFNVGYDKVISSAHRQPKQTAELASTAEEKGYKVIIAGAGLAAALPGVVAAHTLLPVVGLPINSGALQGIDALLAILQMPPGIPVATMVNVASPGMVGIDNARNAALLALHILGSSNKRIRNALAEYRRTEFQPKT